MTIAIATDGQYVSTHFGRCQAYTLVDIENGEIVKSTQGGQSRTCSWCDSCVSQQQGCQKNRLWRYWRKGNRAFQGVWD